MRRYWRTFEGSRIVLARSMFVAIFIGFATTALAQTMPTPPAPEQSKDSPPKRPEPCFQLKEDVASLKKNGAAWAIISDTPFLNTGSAIELGLSEPYQDEQFYFAALLNSSNALERDILNNVSYRRSLQTDTLVKKGLLDPDKVILRMSFDDGVASVWQPADLYVYHCAKSPRSVSQLHVTVSSFTWTTAATWVSIIAAYMFAGFAFKPKSPVEGMPLAIFNPIRLTAGSDGRGSLATLQVLFFSLIVFGLSVFFLLRTGKLSDLSTTVLVLLGISGFGSTIAKGIDTQRTVLHPENSAWLASKQSLPARKIARWTDLITTDGEFDVYRYQTLIFSLAVGIALIASGVSELSSFSIPQTLLGILGLSQAVYIGGKLVTPTQMTDFNNGVKDLRGLELSFRSAVLKQNPNFAGTLEQAQKDAPNEYGLYSAKAEELAKTFDANIRLDPNSNF